MAIAFDAASEDKVVSGGVTTLTYQHTCSGTDRFLWVAVTLINHGATPSATYNGVSMDVLYTRRVVTSTTWTHSVFYLKNPASGTNDVVVTGGSTSGINSIRSGCTSYTGVDQTSPIIASNYANGTGSPMSISLTTGSTGWWIMSGANIDTAFSAGAYTDTLRASYSGLCDIADSGNDISPVTDSATMSFAGTRDWGGIAAAILPAAGAAPRRIFLVT